jgi:hypothetical protein
MSILKSKKIISFILIIFYIFCATPILAGNIIDSATSRLTPIGSVYHGSGEAPKIPSIIANIIQYLLSFLGVLFLGLLIYAGFLWMIASGDEEKITKAKTILQSSLIGIIIILSSYALTYFIIKNLTKATGTYY